MARGKGLRVRFSRASGLTASGLLRRPFYLPVVIGEFTVEEDFPHREYDSHRLGQFSVPGQGGKRSRQLRTTDLEMLTIDWRARWLTEWEDPRTVQNRIIALARSKTPFEVAALLQWGEPEELRMLATIRNIRRTLKPGEADTRYWVIQLNEYRKHGASRRTAGAGKGGVSLPTKHKLRETDTFVSLARRYYGTNEWRHIAHANGLAKPSSPWGGDTAIVKHSRYKVGDFVKIPDYADLAGPISTAMELARRARD